MEIKKNRKKSIRWLKDKEPQRSVLFKWWEWVVSLKLIERFMNGEALQICTTCKRRFSRVRGVFESFLNMWNAFFFFL